MHNTTLCIEHATFTTMQIGYIGLGKMGKNMVLRLLEKGHDIVAWNRSKEPGIEVATQGATVVENVNDIILKLKSPRTIWLMLPAGDVTQQMINQLLPHLEKGDTIIDGANSNFNDTIKRAKQITGQGIHFMDIGVSGGPGGSRTGACLMIGGKQHDYNRYIPLFKDIAAPNAYQFFNGHGAGHFVKMIHNGIEYGMMQAIGEGFEIMKQSNFNLDLEQVARIYNQRSVIESRLVGWLYSGYRKHGQDLEPISGSIKHSGEGEWTLQTARQMNIPAPVIDAAFQFRLDSDQNPSYTGKVVSVLRNEFGGHDVKKES